MHAQTDRGLRQYLKRALRDGCTGEEIIDALLMAFPALGLSKILWAVDVILAMNLPEFSQCALPVEASWHDLGPTKNYKVGQTIPTEAGGRSVFIHRVGRSTFRIYDALCPHQTTKIPHLALKNNQLTCPKHRWVFDISTGACIAKGDAPLKQFEVRVQDGHLLARW